MVGENQFSPVPWRDQDVKQLGEAINKMLNDPDDQVWRPDESRRAFEPYIPNMEGPDRLTVIPN